MEANQRASLITRLLVSLAVFVFGIELQKFRSCFFMFCVQRWVVWLCDMKEEMKGIEPLQA